MKPLVRIFQGLRRVLDKPKTVFILCCLVVFVSLFINGSFWRIWGLRQDLKQSRNHIEKLHTEIRSLKLRQQQARDPMFMEKQARDKLEMAGPDDLVFVFATE